MPLLIMIYKILLVIGITFFLEQYSLHMFDFYLILMCISVFVFGIINQLHELNYLSDKVHKKIMKKLK